MANKDAEISRQERELHKLKVSILILLRIWYRYHHIYHTHTFMFDAERIATGDNLNVGFQLKGEQ